MPGLKVLVHGGGREATKVAAQLGVPTRMVEGRRITDEAMLRVVTMVYGGLVNKGVVAALQARGVNALGLTGADLGCMLAVKRPVKDIDYGFVGDIEKVDTSILADLISRGVVPVMAPLSFDGKGNLLNTNADTIAASVAKALAERFEVTLVYCFEKSGVLKDPDDDGSVIPLITKESFEGLVADGTVAGGILPKLHNAFDALEGGVSAVRITRADAPEGGTKIIL
jgi:acetylglutamate kinase